MDRLNAACVVKSEAGTSKWGVETHLTFRRFMVFSSLPLYRKGEKFDTFVMELIIIHIEESTFSFVKIPTAKGKSRIQAPLITRKTINGLTMKGQRLDNKV
jgi:hypothetical protein